MLRTRVKTLIAAAALVLAGGAATLAAPMASAATPSCGASCVNIWNADFGAKFFMDVKGQARTVGTPIILFTESNTDPALDFTYSNQGTVQEFWEAGLVGSAVALHYGCVAGTGSYEFATCGTSDVNDQAYEIQYSPYGADTGLCVGLAATATAGEKVSLQPCGESARTVWIVDTVDAGIPGTAKNIPLINGSDNNFSQPYVLTYPGGSYPTDSPRPQLEVENLTGFSNGAGTPEGVSSNQLWNAKFGELK